MKAESERHTDSTDTPESPSVKPVFLRVLQDLLAWEIKTTGIRIA